MPERQRTSRGPTPRPVLVLVSGSLVLWLLTLTALRARPVPPEPIPVSRLITSLTDRIQKNRNDLHAVFTLGRVHYFAFSSPTDTVNVWRGTGDKSTLALYDVFGARGKGDAVRGPSTRSLTEAERIEHLKSALTYLHQAVANQPEGPPGDGLFELCLACALEEGAPYASQVGPVAGVPATADAWTRAAVGYYGTAFDKAVASDGTITSRPVFGLATLVSYEAGNSYQRLIRTLGPSVTRADGARAARITIFLDAMANLRPGLVTPVIFAMSDSTNLSELLSERVVRFDLNGSNLPQRYQWVRPDTAILVWDPDRTGRITSGRQLFGSVTWWMFWDDGYQPLSMLDDDRNGWVEGEELTGLSLWFDRNEDGRSGDGEVVPVWAMPIAGLATRATGRTGDAPMNAGGLRLSDGRLLPTYDWVAVPR